MTRADRPPPQLSFAVHAVVYLAAATMIIPFLWMITTSLKTDAEVARIPITLLPRSPQWHNYAEAWHSAQLARYYLNSLIVAAATMLLSVTHNVLAGYAIAKMRFAGRRLLSWAILATMMLPFQVFFIFTYLICKRLGYLDSLQGLIVPFLASGFGIYYMRQVITSVPDSLLEAARMDGMREFDALWHVVRPAAWPGIVALAIFTFVASWNSFFWPLVAIDSSRNNTLPLAINELGAGLYVSAWPVRMAAGVILTLPLIIVFLIFQRAFVQGLTLTGSKE